MNLLKRLLLAVASYVAADMMMTETSPKVTQATWMTVAMVGGAAISAAGNAVSARGANRARERATANASSYLDSLRASGPGYLAEAFGSRMDPEAFLYNPVDLTESQLSTIQGNLRAIPGSLRIQDRVNPAIWRNDQNRIRALMPGFDAARDSYVGTMTNLQAGTLPFSDVQDMISTRASGSGVLATPGGSRNATLRDLGIGRMDAMREGNSMFGNFVQISQQISPVERQFTPQQMFFTPQQRADADIQQAVYTQAGRASAEMARAMPNPAENALVNAQMAINAATMQNPGGGSTFGSILQGLGGMASAYGTARGITQMSQGGFDYGGWNGRGAMGGGGMAQRAMSPPPYSTPYYAPISLGQDANFQSNLVNAARPVESPMPIVDQGWSYGPNPLLPSP